MRDVDVEVVVVGAGVAGLAAAQRLKGVGVDTLVIEARNRVGGRAWTVSGPQNYPIDLGCEWLHSADQNPLTDIAGELGITLETTSADWNRRIANAHGEFEQIEWEEARDAFDRRLEAANGGPDQQASALLMGTKWDALLNAVCTWQNGVELNQLSVRDYAAYNDTKLNWRVSNGLGQLVVKYGMHIPIELETVVTHINHSGARIRIDTTEGSLSADFVVITVPTSLLAMRSIRFFPSLPDKLDAAESLPFGAIYKLFFDFTGTDPIGRDQHFAGSKARVRTGSYQLRPHGHPIISAYFGGPLAREMEAAGVEAASHFAVNELVGLFGSEIRKHLTPVVASGWSADPWSAGAFSYAPPGRHGARSCLAAPVDERIFFAGEACAPQFFTAAHGALLSGWSVADAISTIRAVRPKFK